MTELNLLKETLASFIGALFALLSAGLVWFVKLAYEKHRSEVLALARYERIFAKNNLRALEENFQFLNEWISAVDQNRPYIAHFATYVINDEETLNIGNLKLVNLILDTNLELQRNWLDINSVYNSYSDSIRFFESLKIEEQKQANLDVFNKNIKKILEKLSKDQPVLEKDIIDSIAFTRRAHSIRRHSFFGYLSFLLSFNIWPRVTKQSLEKEILVLRKKYNDIKQSQNL